MTQTKIIKTRINAETLDFIRAETELSGMTISGWLRMIILECKNSKVDFPEKYLDPDAKPGITSKELGDTFKKMTKVVNKGVVSKVKSTEKKFDLSQGAIEKMRIKYDKEKKKKSSLKK